MPVDRVNFGTSGALLHGPPSHEYAPIAAALMPSHTPLLLASRSTRDPFAPSDLLPHAQPRVHVLSGYSVVTLHTDSDGTAVAASSHKPTVAASDVALTSGRWMYEVRVTRAGRAGLGWAVNSAHFSWAGGVGVGDATGSWGVGVTDARGGMQAGANGKWGSAAAAAAAAAVAAAAPVAGTVAAASAASRRWAYGDVIGVCVDVEDGKVSFAVNGVVDVALTTPLTGFNGTHGWLFPALSLNADFTGVVNFGGAKPLAFPIAGYDPVSSAL